MNKPVDVALVIWNPDLIELLSIVLQEHNLTSCGLEPLEDVRRIEEFLALSRPGLVIYDIAPPYNRDARIVLHLSRRFPECAFLLTCADRCLAVQQAAWLSRYAIFQKPYEISEVADAVHAVITRHRKTIGALSVCV